MKNRNLFALLAIVLFIAACEDNIYPKPKAMLRLEYSKPELKGFEADQFSFNYNEIAQVKVKNSSSLTIRYPEMKGAIFINYRKVEDNLDELMIDAQKLSVEHAKKADDMKHKVYENEERKVYGVFYEVVGDAASQAQFFVTDRDEHFVTGSLYFEAKPNYDSIYPATAYLQNDMGRIMETIDWKK